jgi:hypothetical protein
MTHPICNFGTVYSVFVDYQNENKNIFVWFSFRNPCINPYLPIVFDINQLPENIILIQHLLIGKLLIFRRNTICQTKIRSWHLQ